MNKNPEKRHTRVEAHNISKLCETYPGKYPAPSDVYFGDIDCVFSIFKDVEIDMAVMRTAIEIQQEDFDKNREIRGQNCRRIKRIKVRFAGMTMTMPRGNYFPHFLSRKKLTNFEVLRAVLKED